MNNMADVVLAQFWFLNFCAEDELDPDTAVKEIEGMSYAFTNEFSDPERAALSEAAKRSLAYWLQEPDKDGYTPRMLLTADKREFLEAIAEGSFSGPDSDRV